MSENPIQMVCEGSGQATHLTWGNDLTAGVCSMCGYTVTTNNGVAVLHARDDLLAMIERGDFDG